MCGLHGPKCSKLSGRSCQCQPPHCVVYSIGVGEDTSFDEAMIQKYSPCAVYAFDPSLNRKTGADFGLGPNFHYFNIGVGDKDVGIVETEGGKWRWRDDPDYLPWSKMKLTTMMAMFNHTRVDVLKMDVEGSEWRALDAWLREVSSPHPRQIVVKQLLLEAHFGQQQISRERDAYMVSLLGRLESLGFRVFSRRANWRYSRPRGIYSGLTTGDTELEGIRAHACQEITWCLLEEEKEANTMALFTR